MSTVVLVFCVISAVIIRSNVSLTFSLNIVGLVTLVNIGTFLQQIFSWEYEHKQNTFLLVSQTLSVFLLTQYNALELVFTQRQWMLYKKY